jgi:DNA-binding transcriptional LysR family regulator
LSAALQSLDAALKEGQQYNPKGSDRTFRLHMSDIGEMLFLPRLMKMLASRAPRVRVDVRQLDEKDILPALESGRVDLALGYIPALTAVASEVLLQERYVVLMRAGHPLARRAPTRAALAALEYVVVRSHPTTAKALQQQKLGANIRLEIPHFMVLPAILAQTDLAAMIPARLSQAFAALGDYVEWQPRIGLPSFAVSVHWYWRFESDPGIRWLRDRFVELYRE